MKSGEFTIAFTEGLHARPASELASICLKAKSSIKIIKGNITANPKSILGIMAIGVLKDDKITVEVEGEDEEEIFAGIQSFFERK